MYQRLRPYLINFILVTIILIGVAIYFGFTPFGPETVLTVDLGQQYIDFYSLFRRAILGEPELFVYSFQKAIGGEMVGLWAYYLLSPFNLILLFFKGDSLALAVSLLTYLKICAASLSFMYFARYKFRTPLIPCLTFSLSYALMSYLMVFMLNIMWLDGMIMLPLIAVGLEKLIRQEKVGCYVVSLAAMMIINFYIGYMICLFLVLYAFYLVIEAQTASKFNFKQAGVDYGRFALSSIVSACLAGVLLIPTAESLMNNKGSDISFEWNTEIAYHLKDVFSKFFIGAYNFDEMSYGSPNLYAGMIILILVVFYYLNRHIHWRQKLASLLVFAVLTAVYLFPFLDQIWHGGQFPIWYEFRFSFVHSFFMIVLALTAYHHRPKDYPLWQLIGVILAFTYFCYFYYLEKDYEFLTPERIFITLGFGLVYIVLIQGRRLQPIVRQGLILVLVATELTGNALLILDYNGYVDVSKFKDYVSTLDQATQPLRHDGDEFYRIHKTYMRTKDEAMFIGYHGLDHFGSTLEVNLRDLYGYLGLPEGSGFATYTNGTLFTDDFFNVRYLLDVTPDSSNHTEDHQYYISRDATDLDIAHYPIIHKEARYQVHENTERLSVGMEVSADVLDPETAFQDHLPIDNQELLLRLIDYEGIGEPYYQQHAFKSRELHNVEVTDRGDGDYYTYQRLIEEDSEEDAYLELDFDTKSKNPYYFSIPSQWSDKKVALSLNHLQYLFYSPYSKRQVFNASYDLIQDDQNFRIKFLEDEVKSNLVYLYEFDLERYDTMIKNKQGLGLKVDQQKENQLQGTIEIQQDQGALLFSIPYNKNWSAKVDGQKIELVPVLNDTLMAIPLNGGNHRIELTYFPRSIIYGAGVSLVGLAALLILKRQGML